MFTRILVPLDGSSLAETVLPNVVAFARSFNASVTLMHVLTKVVDGRQTPIDPLDWRLRRAEAETYLAEWTDRLQRVGLRADFRVVEGKAADSIVDAARDWDMDLVVICSHGYSGLSKWPISSVAQKVMMRVQTSVLLVRAYRINELFPVEQLDAYHFQQILVPLDGSKRAEYVMGAVRPLLQHAKLTGIHIESHADTDGINGWSVGSDLDEQGVAFAQPPSQCIVAHVVCSPELPRQTQPTHEELAAAKRVVDYNQQKAANYLEQLSHQIGCSVEHQLLVGNDAAASLQRLVEEKAVDLVVLCAHGYNGDPRKSYGSVTTSFIYYSDTPLLIVQDVRNESLDATVAVESTHQKNGH